MRIWPLLYPEPPAPSLPQHFSFTEFVLGFGPAEARLIWETQAANAVRRRCKIGRVRWK